MGNLCQYPSPHQSQTEVQVGADPAENEHFEEEKRNLLLKNQEMQNFINNPSNTKIDIGKSGTYSGGVHDSRAKGHGTIENDQFTFTGEFLNGRPNGPGQMTYKNGASYNGGFVNGFYHGPGTYRSQKGFTYVGDFNMNRFDGQGSVTWTSGAKYVGHFKLDRFDGYGEFTYEDGRAYKGNYRNGLKEGQGTMYLPAQKAVVEGVWRGGKIEAISGVTVEGVAAPSSLLRLN